jgi:hypothetical protein
MVRLLQESSPTGGTTSAATDEDWQLVGHWWADAVGTDLIDNAVLDELRHCGLADDPRERHRGLRLLAVAAFAARHPELSDSSTVRANRTWLASNGTISAR